MKVAAIQHDIVWEDAVATTTKLRDPVAAAAGAGARLVVLSEMFSVGFTMAPGRVAEGPDGPSANFLRDCATRHGVWMCGSVPTIADPTSGALPTNRLYLVSPSGVEHTYDKIHPFSFAGEHLHYAPGTSFLTVDVEGLRTSFFICYDLRFADEFWQLAPVTDCFVVPANWPGVRRHHWQQLLVSRAIENQAYVVGVNRVGTGGELAYVGDSRIVDPLGEMLAGGAGGPSLLVADVDPATVAAVRTQFRFMQDRRTAALRLD